VPADPVARLVDSVNRSIVAVEDFNSEGGMSAGTGFVLQTTPSDAWVVTSYSLVRGARSEGREIQVRLSNYERFPGTVKSVDDSRDLALIVVPGLHLPGIRRFTEPAVQAGAPVVAVEFSAAANKAVGTEVKVSQVVEGGLLLEGTVGTGPVLDAEGNLVGVVPVSYKPRGQEAPGVWVVPAELLCKRLVVCPAGVRPSPTPTPSPG
jgi:hypothetical protein